MLRSASPPWFCHDLDCPPYVVDDVVDNDIELRSYHAGNWVSTNVTGMHYDKAVGVGFMRLFEYISGANTEMQKVDMTAPVRVLATPGQGPFCEDSFKISFFVPFALQNDPPTPASTLVFIDAAAPMRVYVSSYPGFTSETKVVKQAQDLVDRLQDAQDDGGPKTVPAWDASYFYSAGYDSPFRLLNRHNEIWIPVV